MENINYTYLKRTRPDVKKALNELLETIKAHLDNGMIEQTYLRTLIPLSESQVSSMVICLSKMHKISITKLGRKNFIRIK
jgi:uncharacterized membrane protein